MRWEKERLSSLTTVRLSIEILFLHNPLWFYLLTLESDLCLVPSLLLFLVLLLSKTVLNPK